MYNKDIPSGKGVPRMKRYTAGELNQLSKEDMIHLVMQLQKQNAFFEERLAASNAARFGSLGTAEPVQ